MRLATNELPFLYGGVLRALGLPYGAVGAAVRMVQWAEVFHGLGVRALDRRRRGASLSAGETSLLSDAPGRIALGADGQSALLVGPPALDLATAHAHESGQALVTLAGLRDPLWLGQLARQAAKRGLACALSVQCADDDPAFDDLATLYSPGRAVVALPAEPAPLWIELPSAPRSHDRLLSDGLGPAERWPEDCLQPSNRATAGATLFVARLDTAESRALGERLRRDAAAAGATVLEPEAVAALEARALREGLEVPDEVYGPLARFGLTTLVPASADSRRQAGADA